MDSPGLERSAKMAEYDLIIRGGTIVDGTRTPRYVSDIGVKDGKIARIGGLRGGSATRVLDASNLIVAPGFVDLHTHYDSQIQWDPYCTLSGWHGITTVLICNCGFGFAPCREEDRERSMLTMTRNEAIPFDAMKAGMLWDWVTFPEFLDSIDRIPKGVNVFSYVPLSPLYVWVMGVEAAKSRRPTESELKEMCRLVHEGMDAGAFGWSAQIFGEASDQRDYDGTPMITDLMTDEEIFAFARVLAERDEGFIELTHFQVDEHTRMLEEPTWKLYERIAEASGRPILYQAVGSKADDPGPHRRHLQWLEDCARRGLRVYGQGNTNQSGHNFTFEDWNLYDRSPAWRSVTVGSPAERKMNMQNPELRAAIRAEWDAGLNPGLVQDAGNLPDLIIGEVGRSELERYQGLTVGEIAAQEGKHVVDALMDLVVADDLKTEIVTVSTKTNPEYMAEIIKSPYVVPGLSDGGAHVKFSTAGRFPTETLTWLVRDEGTLSLEEAHYNLSYLPAFFGGLEDRGFIREGAPADIVVYDLEGLAIKPLEVAHDFPGGEWRRVQRAEGYRWILVNGQVTFEDGNPTGELPGKLLRHGSDN
jgi:N-acyl-D-aspartate/D-glutamate deacylase